MRKGSAFAYSILVLLLIGLSTSSCLQFLKEGDRVAESSSVTGTDAANAVVLKMQIVETDLIHEHLRLYVTPTLTGRLAAGPRLPARDIELTLASVSGPRVMLLKRDHHVEPFHLEVPLSDGDILLYPMDRYQAWIEA